MTKIGLLLVFHGFPKSSWQPQLLDMMHIHSLKPSNQRTNGERFCILWPSQLDKCLASKMSDVQDTKTEWQNPSIIGLPKSCDLTSIYSFFRETWENLVTPKKITIPTRTRLGIGDLSLKISGTLCRRL